MKAQTREYRKQVLAEVEGIPAEHLPGLVQMIRTFREAVALKPAAASFRQGWLEAQRGDTHPVAALWEDIDAD
jgi:hypothetical protein